MRYWIGVAAKDHVARGVEGGFCQLCHGRAQPLQRMSRGDGIIYYSPKQRFSGAEVCQEFTAIGHVVGDAVYAVPMAADFVPFRRDIKFLQAQAVAIRPLINQLDFIKNKAHWGYVFRFGHIEISREDFACIAAKMLRT